MEIMTEGAGMGIMTVAGIADGTGVITDGGEEIAGTGMITTMAVTEVIIIPIIMVITVTVTPIIMAVATTRDITRTTLHTTGAIS